TSRACCPGLSFRHRDLCPFRCRRDDSRRVVQGLGRQRQRGTVEQHEETPGSDGTVFVDRLIYQKVPRAHREHAPLRSDRDEPMTTRMERLTVGSQGSAWPTPASCPCARTSSSRSQVQAGIADQRGGLAGLLSTISIRSPHDLHTSSTAEDWSSLK